MVMWPHFPSDFPLFKRFVSSITKNVLVGSYKINPWKDIPGCIFSLTDGLLQKALHQRVLSVYLLLYLPCSPLATLSPALRLQPSFGPASAQPCSQRTTTDWKQLWTLASSEQWESGGGAWASKPRPLRKREEPGTSGREERRAEKRKEGNTIREGGRREREKREEGGKAGTKEGKEEIDKQERKNESRIERGKGKERNKRKKEGGKKERKERKRGKREKKRSLSLPSVQPYLDSCYLS